MSFLKCIGVLLEVQERAERGAVGGLLAYRHRAVADGDAVDAMFAPVVTRFLTYDVKLDPDCAAYCETVMAMPAMQEWIAGAKAEPDEVEELDVEF